MVPLRSDILFNTNFPPKSFRCVVEQKDLKILIIGKDVISGNVTIVHCLLTT